MPKKNSAKTLSEIREENMKKWKAKDYEFYSDFLSAVPSAGKKKKKPGRKRKD